VSTRLLVGALIAQVLVGGALVWGAVTGFQFAIPGVSSAGSSANHAAAGKRFDPSRALATARRQVHLGPRPAGSALQRTAAGFLKDGLPGGHYVDIGGGLRNIAGSLPGRGEPILLIAHYDTTPVPGYLGANNSAAAVGAVMEIARDLKADHRPGRRPVQFLLTDGEEAPTYPVQGDFFSQGLRGSRFAAHSTRATDVIAMDFVGQRRLRIPREAGSDAGLWAKLRAAAGRAGRQSTFPSGARPEVLDDHTPFARRGIRAIDLIDFDYPCWQKPCDTLDKLDEQSIAAAGETVLELVRTLR